MTIDIKVKRFNKSEREKIGYYVYALIDPRYHEVFYIGVGHGNRVGIHVKYAKSDKVYSNSEKITRIREIRRTTNPCTGKKYDVEEYIVLGGQAESLSEEAVYQIEAAFLKMDALRLRFDNLTNKVTGKDRKFICWETVDNAKKKLNKTSVIKNKK